MSDAHLRGEAACTKLQEKLDISGAALQTAASQHKEVDKQKRAADKKLVWSPSSFKMGFALLFAVSVPLPISSLPVGSRG